ncbi:MAG: RimK family alpha-L-glutamate ligase [Gemmataceae bacterium]
MKIALLAGPIGWHAKALQHAAEGQGHRLEVVAFSRLVGVIGQTPKEALERFREVSLDQFEAVLVRTMPLGSLEQVVFRMDALQTLEKNRVRVMNPPRTLEICIDKYLAGTRLVSAGLPFPKTAVCQTSEQSMEAFEFLGKDVVVKPIFGSEGRGILRVSDPDLAWRTFRTLERTQSVLYLQQYINHPGWDLRVFVLDGRVLASMKRHSDDDWRTNVARGGKCELATIGSLEEELALRATEATGVVVAGVDLLPNPEGGYFVLEVNGVPGWRALTRVCDVDIAGEMIRWLTRNQ